MKHAKILGLSTLAVGALMVFAGTASADTLTSASGTTPPLKATSTNLTMYNAVGTVSCDSSVEGTVEGHGPGKSITSNITSLTFTSCVGGFVHNETLVGGSLSLNVTGTNHGTLSSSGANYTTTAFGVVCGYSTNATSLGTVTAGKEHAVLDISASLTRTHGSFFCGNTANWTGTFQFASPTNVHLHND